jgi:hypothetical protein
MVKYGKGTSKRKVKQWDHQAETMSSAEMFAMRRHLQKFSCGGGREKLAGTFMEWRASTEGTAFPRGTQSAKQYPRGGKSERIVSSHCVLS